MSPVCSVIVNLRTREVQPMCELQPAFLAGMQSVQVHHPWPSRSATGPPLHHGPVAATPPEPRAGPVLWARCWGRIRTWRVPPRWSVDGLARRGPRPGGALAACLARREFSGSVASTAQTSSGQASGSKAKKPAHHSNHAAHQSPRRTAPHAAVTVHGRQVPAGPIRKPRVQVRK
jgi:hypothetical protein